VINSGEILNRIKDREGFGLGHGSETLLARFLGISPQTLDKWRERGIGDWEAMLNKCKKYDYNILITGEKKANELTDTEKLEFKSMQTEILTLAFEKQEVMIKENDSIQKKMRHEIDLLKRISAMLESLSKGK
jgi:hypothetical protein